MPRAPRPATIALVAIAIAPACTFVQPLDDLQEGSGGAAATSGAGAPTSSGSTSGTTSSTTTVTGSTTGASSQSAGGGDGGAGGEGPGGGDAGAGQGGGGASGTGGEGGATTTTTTTTTSSTGSGGGCGFTEACMPLPPAGWSGPAILYVGSDAVECPAGYPNVGYEGGTTIDEGAIDCSACSCANPTGISCSLPAVSAYEGVADCTGATTPFTPPAAFDQCLTRTVTAPSSFKFGPSVASGGSCAPSGVTANADEPFFSVVARTCSVGGGGAACDGGICVDAPELPFQPKICAYRAGDVDCPAEYPEKDLVYHRAIDDERTCTACTCGAPAGASCSGFLRFHTTTDCSGGSAGIGFLSGNTGCYSVANASSLIYPSADVVANDGACAPGGGQPTGSAAPIQPVTVCCAR